jgi:hypothetical protein
MPLGRVQGFSHLFGGASGVPVPPPRPTGDGGGLGALWATLWGVGQLVVLSVVVYAGGVSTPVCGTAFIMSVMFVGLFIIGRFAWAPSILRGHPVIPVGWAAALLVGGAMGWALRNSRVEDCRSETATLNAMNASGDLTWRKQGVPNLERLGERAARASITCDRVGLDAEASEAKIVLEQIGPEVMSGRDNDRQIARVQSAPTSTGTRSTDPANCPNGKVLIDSNTGTLVHCTGPEGAPTAGTSFSGTTCSTHWEMKSECEEQVKSMLKAPSEAQFPGILDVKIDVDPVTCKNTYRSWVDAPNSFNAKLGQQYVCTYDPKTDIIRVTFAD